MYAIIETGGKQYRVAEGDTLDVELLRAKPGQVVELNRVLLVASEDRVHVGTPTVEGATVRARVVETVKGPKIVVFKYKPKNRYRRKTGHRQKYTRLQIDEIVLPGAEEEPEVEAEEPVAETPVAEASVAEAPAAPGEPETAAVTEETTETSTTEANEEPDQGEAVEEE